MADFIRNWIRKAAGEEAAETVRVVYGGSVTETNADNIARLPALDGFLIGSTSTKPNFSTIFEIINEMVETRHATQTNSQ